MDYALEILSEIHMWIRSEDRNRNSFVLFFIVAGKSYVRFIMITVDARERQNLVTLRPVELGNCR